MSARRICPPLLLAASTLAACSSAPQHGGQTAAKRTAVAVSPREQVLATERAFARTMAARDLAGFTKFLSSEAIFFSGNIVERGPAAIEAAWKPFFAAPAAPFSWAPDDVEVLPSGKLALSTGPVYVQGQVVSRFNSVWRLEGDTWRIVFDKGEAVCSARP